MGTILQVIVLLLLGAIFGTIIHFVVGLPFLLSFGAGILIACFLWLLSKFS